MHAPLKGHGAFVEQSPGHHHCWLLRGPMPIIIVDWANLKGEGRWYLLRASTPVGGRTITLLNQLYPLAEQSTPKAQQDFLL